MKMKIFWGYFPDLVITFLLTSLAEVLSSDGRRNVKLIDNTPGTAAGPGGRDQTLAVKS